ncbi:MAG: DUF4040 domain-containing protein [Mobilicoccus sp.]|nr:DUF4040 domain-containing protein [Mobilicoccus sp.]
MALPIAVSVVVVGAALVALYGRGRVVTVAGFLVFGAMLSLYWGLIGAPDVGLAEAAIGTGVTGALFVHAATALPDPPQPRSRSRWTVPVLLASGVLGGVMGVALVRAADALDRAGLAAEVTEALPDTGVEHPVTGVLLNLRSYDTLLEIVVLLAAVAVALALVPRPSVQVTPPAVLDTLVRVTTPVLFLVAAWLLVAGSSRPGGAFQSGAVVAATLILLHASGVRPLTLGPLTRMLLSAGLAAFLAVAVGGLIVSGDTWLLLRGDFAGTIILVLEAALAVTIGFSLAMLYLATARGRA